MRGQSIVGAIKSFIRRAELDPGLAPYEGLVYKAAFDGQGANVLRVIADAARDAEIMVALELDRRRL